MKNSGKKETTQQHYIPRCLMAGFASRIEPRKKGPEIYSHFFRVGQKAKEPNLNNIGGERFFYAKAEDNPVEGLLSQREDTYAKLLQEIRQRKIIPQGSESLIAEIIACMAMRTKNIRVRVTEFTEAAIPTIRTDLTKSRVIERQVRNDLREKSKQYLSPNASRVERRLFYKANQKGREQELRNKFSEVMHSISMPKLVRTAQVRALQDWPDTIVQPYAHFQWRVSVSSEQLILGDIGPVCESEESNKFSVPLLSIGEGRGRVLLPIGPNLIIIGNSSDSPQASANWEQLNVASARLSIEFFIASENTSREQQYHSLIGSDREVWLQQAAQQGLLKL